MSHDKDRQQADLHSKRFLKPMIEKLTGGNDKKFLQLEHMELTDTASYSGNPQTLSYKDLLVDPLPSPEMKAIIEECYHYARSGAKKLSRTLEGTIWLLRCAPLEDEPLTFKQIAAKLNLDVKDVKTRFAKQEQIIQEARKV